MIEDNKITERVVDSETTSQDLLQEEGIRPHSLEDFVGQKELVENLKIFIQAAKQREEALEHILFYGPPGLGKTTLSMIIAHEMGSNLHTAAGPSIERAGDIAALLTNLQPFDVLFIDEIHRMRPNIEEVLYSAMEDGFLDIMIGKGPTAKSMKLDLVPFTLVGATTRLSSVSSPLRDRFGSVMRLNFYSNEDMETIVKRSARILDVKIDSSASFSLGRCSRKTPRIANRLLRRVRDFAQVGHVEKIQSHFVEECLQRLYIDSYGLDNNDRRLLSMIFDKFDGGPVGISTLAAALSEEENTIENVYEPFLLQLGFLERTPRGRKVTLLGKEYMQNSQIKINN